MYIEFDFQIMTIITHEHRMSDTFAKGSYYKKKDTHHNAHNNERTFV